MKLRYVESNYFCELRNWHQKTESIVKHRIFDHHLTKILFSDGKEEHLSTGGNIPRGCAHLHRFANAAATHPNDSSVSKQPPKTLTKLAKPAYPPKKRRTNSLMVTLAKETKNRFPMNWNGKTEFGGKKKTVFIGPNIMSCSRPPSLDWGHMVLAPK